MNVVLRLTFVADHAMPKYPQHAFLYLRLGSFLGYHGSGSLKAA